MTDNNPSAAPLFAEDTIEIPMDYSAWITPIALFGCLAVAVALASAFALS